MQIPDQWEVLWQESWNGAELSNPSENVHFLQTLAGYAPRRAGLPSGAVVRDCFDIATAALEIEESAQKRAELALALACGWRRKQIQGIDSNWNNPWPKAREELTNRISKWIGDFFDNLSGRYGSSIRGRPEGIEYLLEHGSLKHPHEYASIVVRSLLARPQSEPKKDYLRNRLLRYWDPTEHGLEEYVRRSVFGQPFPIGRSIRANTFPQGLLAGSMGIESGGTALKLCCGCWRELPYDTKQCCDGALTPDKYFVTSQDRLLFDMVYGPGCFRSFTPKRHTEMPPKMKKREVYHESVSQETINNEVEKRLKGLSKKEKRKLEPVLKEEIRARYCPHPHIGRISQRVAHLRVRRNPGLYTREARPHVLEWSDEDRPQPALVPVDQRTPQDEGELRESESLLEEAMKKLNPLEREVIQLKYFLEVSDRETARVVGCEETELNEIIHKTLLKMSKHFPEGLV